MREAPASLRLLPRDSNRGGPGCPTQTTIYPLQCEKKLVIAWKSRSSRLMPSRLRGHRLGMRTSRVPALSFGLRVAIRHQVKVLEEALSITLFKRRPSGLAFTDEAPLCGCSDARSRPRSKCHSGSRRAGGRRRNVDLISFSDLSWLSTRCACECVANAAAFLSRQFRSAFAHPGCCQRQLHMHARADADRRRNAERTAVQFNE